MKNYIRGKSAAIQKFKGYAANNPKPVMAAIVLLLLLAGITAWFIFVSRLQYFEDMAELMI